MKKILTVFFCLISYQVFGHDYYCSRSDIFLRYLPNPGASYASLSSGSDGYSEVYQRTVPDGGSSVGKITFGISDCSNDKFECLHFLEGQSNKKDFDFYIFLPRLLEANKEYEFKGIKLLTKVAGVSPFMSGGKSKIPIIQATIWQQIDGQETPIKLTVEEKRGVIYWDGLNVWPEKFNIGETCILQSEKGFLSDVKIKKVVLSGSRVD